MDSSSSSDPASGATGRQNQGVEARAAAGVASSGGCFQRPGADEHLERIVERLHAVPLAGLDHGEDVLELVVADQSTHGGVRDQDLGGEHVACGVPSFQAEL